MDVVRRIADLTAGPATAPSGRKSGRESGLERRTAAAPGSRPERVLHVVRTFSTRRWMVGHLIVIVLAVTMVLLGRWQLDVSNSKGFDLQNFGYTLQWWAFTAFGLFMWVRIMRDHKRRADGTEPVSAPKPSGEIVHAPRNDGGQHAGPAVLATRTNEPGQAPVVYRGYVVPNSSDAPVRSHGDGYHDSYNDYLWQLSLADDADRTRAERAHAERARADRPDLRARRAMPAEPPPEIGSRPAIED